MWVCADILAGFPVSGCYLDLARRSIDGGDVTGLQLGVAGKTVKVSQSIGIQETFQLDSVRRLWENLVNNQKYSIVCSL